MNVILKRCAILLLLVSLSSCELFEDNDKRTYFKAEGIGYVYNWHTKEPAQNVRVTVTSSFKDYGWATKQPIKEIFYTDNTGFFRIKFLKRTQKENVAGITVNAYDETNNISSEAISYTVDKLNELILKLDTLWIRY